MSEQMLVSTLSVPVDLREMACTEATLALTPLCGVLKTDAGLQEVKFLN